MNKNDIESINMATGIWGKVRAYATVKLSCGLSISGVKVVQGKSLFTGMPSIQRKNKESGEIEWKDCCYLENEEDWKAFNNIIIDVYNAKISDKGEEPDAGKENGDVDKKTESYF